MKVKDKLTGKILTTESVWLKKLWKLNPKRYLTEWKEEKPKTSKKKRKKAINNGLRK